MNSKILILCTLIFLNTFTFFIECKSQNFETIHDCRVLSIDSINLGEETSSCYHLIYLNSEIGKIVLMKPYPDNDTVINIKDFKKGIIFNINANKIDSIPFCWEDSTCYMKFNDVRGGNGGYIFIFEYDTINSTLGDHIEFDDFNYFPYKPTKLFNPKIISLLKNCKILSIDTLSILPYYYIINARYKKENILILSKFKKYSFMTNENELKLGRKYDFYTYSTDYIQTTNMKQDYGVNFIIDSISNCLKAVDQEDKTIIEFSNIRQKPFRTINLVGIDYDENTKYE